MKPGRNKYGVRLDAKGRADRTSDGMVFDSKAERIRYDELRMLVRAGRIRDLELQPKYDLVVTGVETVRVGQYRADFRYFDVERGESVTEDVKGCVTALYRLKSKLVRALHGVTIEEIRRR